MLSFAAADVQDIEDLLRLYFIVYGANYPLAFGSDRQMMQDMLQSPDILWMAARDGSRVIGSAIIRIDSYNRIGKLEGVVVDPSYRKQKIGHRLVEAITEAALSYKNRVDSIYTTTRSTSIAPQAMCLANGYIPMGIFPNAHRILEHETLTLMVRYASGILERRQQVLEVPQVLAPILAIANAKLRANNNYSTINEEQKPDKYKLSLPSDDAVKYELINAPHFVKRHYAEAFAKSELPFYPFHTPNLLVSATDGSSEAYIYLSPSDRYCALLASRPHLSELDDKLPAMITALINYDVSYLEALVPISDHKSIEALHAAQFIPSAIYPAMREIGGQMHDFMLMSRTMHPLNFRRISIERTFKPYVDQFIESWKKTNIDSFEVVDDYQ